MCKKIYVIFIICIIFNFSCSLNTSIDNPTNIQLNNTTKNTDSALNSNQFKNHAIDVLKQFYKHYEKEQIEPLKKFWLLSRISG